MKNTLLILAMALLIAACVSSPTPELISNPDPVLTVIMGEIEKTFNVESLKGLAAEVSSFDDIDYLGVPVEALLEAAGINTDQISVIKAIATDGYSVNYEPGQLFKDGVIVAYSLADGNNMTSDDGNFRMVLPDQEGNQNLRLMYKIKVTP